MLNQKQYFVPLDGMRGIAAIPIIFAHMGWFPAGWLGLQYFFVLSGFLITRILLREKEKNNFFPSWKRYFFRRGLRVFPLYFGYLLLLGIIYFLTGVPKEFGEAWPMLFSFSYNLFRPETGFPISEYFVHFWSLCVEEQFYLVWPLLVLFLNRRYIGYFLFALLFIAPLSRFLIAEWMKTTQADAAMIGDTVWMNTFCKLDGIAMGALIALKGPENHFKKTGLLTILSAALFLCCGLGVNYLSYGKFDSSYFTTFGFDRIGIFASQQVYSLTLANLIFFFLIISVISGKNKSLNRFLEHPMFVFSGKISFGIYIFHYPVIQLLKDYGGIDMNSWLAPFAVIPLIYLIAGLSFFLYEKRFLDMKERFK